MPKILLLKSFWGLRVHTLFCIFPLLLSSFFSWSQTLTSCSSGSDIIVPIHDYIGNGHLPYRLHHKDGTYGTTFFRDETIYSYGVNTATSCRQPNFDHYRTPIMPETFVAQCTPVNTPFFFSLTPNQHIVIRTCQVVFNIPFTWARVEHYKATTTGEFSIPFRNSDGTRVNLTIIDRYALYSDCGNLAGSYIETGTQDGKKKFVDSDGNELYFDSTNGQWVVRGSMGIAYSVASTSDEPPTEGWKIVGNTCIGRDLKVVFGEYLPNFDITYTISNTCQFDGIYKFTDIQNDRPVLTSANNNRISFKNSPQGWQMNENGPFRLTSSLNVPTTWDNALNCNLGPAKIHIVEGPKRAVLNPVNILIRTLCENQSGKFIPTTLFNERPDLTGDNGNRLYYWGSGDPNRPAGWYITDANNSSIYFNNSMADRVPTSGWVASTRDGISCSNNIGVFENELEPCPTIEKISYVSPILCKDGSEAQITILGSTGGVFSSTQGLSINTQTGGINLNESNSGPYTITYSLGGTNGCELISTTTSVTIEDQKIPTISLDATGGMTITTGTSVTFTATPTNGGTAPTYVWKKNDTVIPNESGATYTASDLANGDKIKVEMTSNDPCASPTMATSNEITMVVTVPESINPCPSDGVTWQPRDAAEANVWRSVSYGNRVFVAVSENGTNRVMTSRDGITWTAQAAPENNTWTSVTYGNSLFVAVASDGVNQVMTSPDGVNWSARLTPEFNSWSSVTFGNGLFVAVSEFGNVMVSTDAMNWTVHKVPESNQWSSITYGNGLFVAVSRSGSNRIMTSPNGIDWTPVSAPENNAWTSITHGNGLFVAVSNSGLNRIMTSQNGSDWTSTFGAVLGRWRAVTYGNGMFVSVSQDRANPSVATSTDGINWIGRAEVMMEQFWGITYGDGQFVAVGGSSFSSSLNRILVSRGNSAQIRITSTDSNNLILTGESITFMATPTHGGDSPLYQWRKNDIPVGSNSPSYTDNSFVNGDIITLDMTSSDACVFEKTVKSNPIRIEVLEPTCVPSGVNWSDLPIVAGGIQSVTFGNGMFVAIGRSNSSDVGLKSRIITSLDGINWTSQVTPADNNWRSVTYGNGLFVAVSDNTAQSSGRRTMTSPDGVHWTMRVSSTRDLYSVAFGNGMYVALGAFGDNNLVYSPDGVNWTQQNAVTRSSWDAVTFGGGKFVAVSGNDESPVMTSTDGINWTAHTFEANSDWKSVTYGNNRFVAVAAGGPNRTMTSTDGINWTVQNGGIESAWQSVTFGDGKFIAVASSGDTRVMTSTDGINWTPQVASDTHAWRAIAFGNDVFIALSQDNSAKAMISRTASLPSVSTNVSLAASPGNEITPGTSVTFTATPTNGGTAPTYVWKKNDTVIPSESGATYTASDLVDGDKIKVEMTSNDPCASPTMATSNEVTVEVGSVRADYQITTVDNAIVLTDVSGNDDVLEVIENGNQIQFNAAGRTFSLNGGPVSSFPANVSLTGATSITIETNVGQDIVNVGGFTTALPSLLIKGSEDNESIHFTGNLTFLPDANLEVDLQSASATPGKDQVLIGENTVLSLSGTGSATFRVKQNIRLSPGSTISSVNGNIILEANQGAIGSEGDFTGIEVNGGIIDISGSGKLEIKGKASTGGGGERGINIDNDAKISGGSGDVLISGQGGFGTGSSQSGIRILGPSIIESKGGNISLSGINEANTGGTQYGISMSGAVLLKAGGLGTVRVEGTGGLSASRFSAGIRIGDGATITSSGGKVIVLGTGRGTSTRGDHNGIRLSGGIISAGLNGDVEVVGTATQGASAGVRISDDGGMITSEGGAISVTGTGSAGEPDIELTSGGVITSTSGSITLNGVTQGIWPNTTGVDVRVASNQKLTLGSGTKLNLDIDGTILDEEYRQLNLEGILNLNTAALTFEGSSYKPLVGDVFTIVQNDGTDAIEGTFAGLPEAASITNFLGSGLNAFISYVGGDGNDVVISVKTPCVIPSAPEALAQSFCGTATVANLVATGTTIQWYAAETGGSALSSTTALATGTYYASQTVDGCESPRTSASVTLNPIPAAPTALAQSFCGEVTVQDLVATGTGIQWYAAQTGGTALASTTTLATGTYYASQTINGCESVRTAVRVTTNSVTSMPDVEDQAFCERATVGDLASTGSNVQWYLSATGGAALTSTTALATGAYYATQTVNGCESERVKVEVIVNPTPLTLTMKEFVSPTTCAGKDGSIAFTSNLADGVYKLEYLKGSQNEIAVIKDVTVAGGGFVLSELEADTYLNFFMEFNGCVADVSGPIELTSPSLSGGLVSGSTSLISGINAAALDLSGHTGTIVKWQSARDLNFTNDLTDIAITATRLEITNLNETRFYRAVVEGLGCPPVFSSVGSVTVVQNQAPIARCKNITKPVNDLCSTTVTVEELDNGSFDPEGGELLRMIHTMGPFSVGQYPIELTVHDPNGLSASCISTLTVVDQTSPWIVTKSAELYLDANGRATLSAAQVDAGSSDNCGIRSMQVSKTNFTCMDIGQQQVILTITDLSGNQSSAEATVFVLDTRPPVAVANNQTVYLNAQGIGALDIPAFARGSNDNCGIADVSVNIGALDCSHLGTQPFTLTVRDFSGNTAQMDARVTVLDTIAPRVVVRDTVLFADAQGNASLMAHQVSASIVEACGVESTEVSATSFSCGTQPQSVLFTARDRQGNVGFTRFLVTVRDTIAPVIQTQPVTVFVNDRGLASLSAQQVDNGTMDNCGLDSISISQTDFACNQVGDQEITFRAVDRSGNRSEVLVKITVRDTLAPIVRTIPATLVLDGQGIARLRVADIDTGSTDNCGIASQEIAKTTFTCEDLGVRRIVYRVTDVHGNVGLDTLTITVRDTIAPTLVTRSATLVISEDEGPY